MKKIVLGILAHVDAGKTTLSEGLLYTSGATDKLGRVDKRDAYLDTHSLERERGITIFSKQAVFDFGDSSFTLIDTPGHIDFSCEAERALSVQDYAILIVSAPDGITAHTKTLWHLLAARRIPTFIFVNKTDISERRRDGLMAELSAVLSGGCVDFTDDTTPEFYESVAATDEAMMSEFFEREQVSRERIAAAVRARRVFPCFFGSALKMRGVEELLVGIDKYTLPRSYSDSLFGARVFKIGRDPSGKRLTYLKMTGGVLRNKDVIEYKTPSGERISEKVEEIRLYSGDRYSAKKDATPGSVVAVLGLTKSFAGQGLGTESDAEATLTPVLDYRMNLPGGVSAYETFMRLMVLSEEDPSLALTYDPATHEIRVRLMGEIQLEILTRIIAERFGVTVSFDEGSILYKETVADTVYGAGHFEPLRHYAEVHIRIEPMAEGTGVVTATECPTDSLALNWQRLILTHLEERVHRGVLTGSPLTDVRIVLMAGRAHLKHTEGGDFRQATYRAVRQGLMKSESVLLEPTFDFRAELPSECLGRFMTDITNMHGSCDAPEFLGDTVVIEGNCPVYTMRSYASELRAYTRGAGRIAMTVGPYAPCHNTDEVIAARGYDPDLDERHPAASVFCKAGSGYTVPWHEADELMHIDLGLTPRRSQNDDPVLNIPKKIDYRGTVEEDKELMRIFERTYGKIKPRAIYDKQENAAPTEKRERPKKQKPRGEDFVIIDGYNFIFACEPLARAAASDFGRARDMVIRMMCDYTAYHRCRSIIVFDAGRRRGGDGSVEECGAVTVVYTKEAETADSYIEKTTHGLTEKHTVRVVTSDKEEQFVILGAGGLRVSAREFYGELESTALLIRETVEAYAR